MNSLMATVATILCKLTWKQPSWIWGESFQFEIHSKLAAGYQMALFLGRNIKSQLRNYKMADEWGTRKTMKISLYFLNDPPLNATQTFRLINRSGGGRLFYANELLSSAKRKSFFFSKLEQSLWAHSAIGKKRKSQIARLLIRFRGGCNGSNEHFPHKMSNLLLSALSQFWQNEFLVRVTQHVSPFCQRHRDGCILKVR